MKLLDYLPYLKIKPRWSYADSLLTIHKPHVTVSLSIEWIYWVGSWPNEVIYHRTIKL